MYAFMLARQSARKLSLLEQLVVDFVLGGASALFKRLSQPALV